MNPCPHKHVEARIWLRHADKWIRLGRSRIADALICRDCGEWLSLGPSNDDSEAVRVEILAAYLALPECAFAHVAHKDHHDTEDCDENYCFAFRHDCMGCLGGWLAREITAHSEPQ